MVSSSKRALEIQMEAQEVFQSLLPFLRARRQTLGFAESCTGGLLSALVAAFPGVSDVFLGSVVAYANQLKQDFLQVPSTMISAHGAVSAPVALAMAKGLREKLKSSWAVSITGVAGPSGGSVEKPVGTVWIAAVGPGFEERVSCKFEGDRAEIQAASALRALQLLAQGLG